jgi:trehalose-phosphatase
MALPLDAHLEAVADVLRASEHVLIALDFDGTLTPIVASPAQAKLSAAARANVRELARQPRSTVAVVSGRALEDVRKRLGIDEIFYAGNHGLEIAGGTVSFVHPGAESAVPDLEAALAKLQQNFDGIPGVEIEHKGLTASIHFRRVARDKVLPVRLAVRAAVADAERALICREGKEVLEIRPAVHWHKGFAVRWIRDQLSRPDVACVYVGDDSTDEDAFQALPGSVTVRVGEYEETAARYSVADTEAVHRFVRWLSQQLGA